MLSASLPLGLQVPWNLGTKKHEWNGEDTLCAMYVGRPKYSKYFLFRDIWDSHLQCFTFCSRESQGVITISSGIMRWEKNMASQDFPGTPTLCSMPCVMGLHCSHAVFIAHSICGEVFGAVGWRSWGTCLTIHPSCVSHVVFFFTAQALAFGSM